MTSELSGRVVYANGVPAASVRVRVFDKDAPGKGDDDLTITEGLADAHGAFTVRYDEDRFRDFAELPHFGLGGDRDRLRFPDLFDVFSPYLQFAYEVGGETRMHTTGIPLFGDLFRLPDTCPLEFKPSVHGFRFANLFHGYMLPFTIPGFPPAKVPGAYGLCGGMSSAAFDYLLAGRSIPSLDHVPSTGSRLHRYLFRRAIDTFDMGETILRFARWMALPEEGPRGTERLTAIEFDLIRQKLSQHHLIILGLLFDKGQGLQEIIRNVWNNHQVLAYGYTHNPDGSFDIQIYDPNYAKADDVFLHAEPVSAGEDGQVGLRCAEMRGNQVLRPVRGFFEIPYKPADPPEIS